jgi:hypothetical protein
MGRVRNAKFWFKDTRKRALARPRHRWNNNIGMDCTEIRWETVDWIHIT